MMQGESRGHKRAKAEKILHVFAGAVTTPHAMCINLKSQLKTGMQNTH
jgi:hypothetical protein